MTSKDNVNLIIVLFSKTILDSKSKVNNNIDTGKELDPPKEKNI